MAIDWSLHIKNFLRYFLKDCKTTARPCQCMVSQKLYKDFETTYRLFKFPVVDEQDKHSNLPTACLLSNHPQRQQLLRSTALFAFDEFPSLDREVFKIYKEMKQFQNTVVVCIGDICQLPPVKVGGDRAAIVIASTNGSPLWNLFRVMHAL